VDKSVGADFQHTPVLLREVTDFLRVKSDGKYIDCTIGGGGHSAQVLKSGAVVLGIDQDLTAILHLKKKFESEIKAKRLILEHDNFVNVAKAAEKLGFIQVDGILFDLGVSSFQIDQSGRGFSFKRAEPLDMRMNPEVGLTAAGLLNDLPEEELYTIFAKYGEERRSRDIARQIVAARKLSPITTTEELAGIVTNVLGESGIIHPATRIFQALRIAVNSEIENLKIGLKEGFKLLNLGGRLAVISFHSLEDRVVKLQFLEFANEGQGKILTKKPVVATEAEIKENKRARSAKLRVIEKIKK
jgi:16S rRNA (cytosine1402-N4)-methyltransferase